ncbi:MAG: M42 family metallopeptidase [Candidatus Lokiarchaeota archaeon]|nr:M42 family metallopeptidase [Candidatus Lokiarchaeota archaeon]
MEREEYISKIVERQKQLSEILGVSGHEEKVVEFIQNEVKDIMNELWVDVNGNLIGIMKGESEDGVLLDAHTDEIGFMITHVDEKGFCRFTSLGGWDPRTLLGQSVIAEPIGKRIHGVIGALPPHITKVEERTKPVPIEQMFIDFGFISKKEANEEGIIVGSVATAYSGFQELVNGKLKGKAFDDRSGCNVLIQTAINIANKKRSHTVCFTWSTQEEVGARGARTSAFTVMEKFNIIMALACENTTAAGVPGVAPYMSPSLMGKGAAITLMDNSMIASKKVRERLIKIAESEKIPYQIKTPSGGGTDAGVIHITKHGVPSGVVSVPGRYIHSPCTIIDRMDLVAACDLVTAFVLHPMD